MKSVLCILFFAFVLASFAQASQPAKAQGALECSVCEFVVGAVEKYVSDNATETEILTKVEGACSILPASVATICKGVVSAYGPEIINHVIAKESPAQACGAVGLCNNSTEIAQPVIKPSKVEGGLECTVCEFVVGEVEKFLEANATESEILTKLESACSILPASLASVCKGVVAAYGPAIINHVINKESPAQACGAVGLCSNSSEIIKPALTHANIQAEDVKGGLECTVCEFVVGEVEKFLKDNATESEILTKLESACSILPASLASVCKGVVAAYGPAIINHVINKESPAEACGAVGLCSNSTEIAKPAPAHANIQSENVGGGIECTVCEFVVGEVEKFLEDNATETEILTKLESACSILPASLASVCKGVVAAYGPAIINHVINKESPAQACGAVGLCSNSTEIVQPAVEPASIHSELTCGVCTYLVGMVENYLSENATESVVLTMIEKDCSLLRDQSWVATCQGTVATFGPEIISLVLAKQPASVVCTEIGLCNSSSVAAPAKTSISIVDEAPVATSGNDTLGCDLCEMLVQMTEKYIAANQTEGEVIDALKDVCAKLPVTSWATACTNMVVEYGDVIVAYIVNEEPPEVVCTEIRLCDATERAFLSFKTPIPKN